MFDGWEDSADYPTLFRVCREVSIDTARIFPPSGIRKDELPMFVKSGGLLLEPSMRGRQIAWIRRADGGWLAVCELKAASANGRSRVNMQLWLPPDALTADVDDATT
ncbi:hypothetical protein H7I77_09820 [Mycolicibacterium novocastrense]|nr:hypothetical protein [Mycolicibacterium novocastrense]